MSDDTLKTIAALALGGGAVYLLATKTNLLSDGKKDTPQIIPVLPDSKLISDGGGGGGSIPGGAARTDTKILLDDGDLLKLTHVSDSEGNEYAAKTTFGNEGLLVDTLDLGVDVTRTFKPNTIAAYEYSAQGNETEAKKASVRAITDNNPVFQAVNLLKGAGEAIGGFFGF